MTSQSQDIAAFDAHLHKQGFRGEVLTPEQQHNSFWAHRFSGRLEVNPPRIIVPEHADDVCKAVRAASATSVELAVQSGGCNISGEAVTANGVMVHLGKIQEVVVDQEKRIAHVGGGCLWGQVYSALSSTNLEAVGASLGIVGVGGFLTMGGYSCWSGMHGLGIDNVVSAEVVTGIGDKVLVDVKKNADLFWGVRGGVSNFGIVTRFTIRLHEKTGEINFANLIFPGTQASKILEVAEQFVEKQTAQQVCIMTFARPVMIGQPCVILTFFVYGSRSLFEETIAPFVAAAEPIVKHAPLAATQHEFGEMGAVVFNKPGKPNRHDARVCVLKHFTRDLAEQFWDAFLYTTEDKRFTWSYATFELHNLTVLSENPHQVDNAWVHRHRHIYSLIDVLCSDSKDDGDADKAVDVLADALERAHQQAFDRPSATWTLWSTVPPSLQEAYGSSLTKLTALKHKYDPHNVFACSLSVAGHKRKL